jgi:energy-coupling factor transporter ATP-binding protein EcfA2
LDPATRGVLWCWLRDLTADGHIVVISTHDIAEGAACPLVLHFADGRVDGPMQPASLAWAAARLSPDPAIPSVADGAPT